MLKNIAIIPARSGSKGLKDKNIKKLCGKPLLAYTIECALESQKFDKVFVSTDSEEYAKIAQQYGADASFLRSKDTSGDTAGSWDVVKEVISCFEKDGLMYDNIMLLQPTSPLRMVQDIHSSFQLMKEKEANVVLSVTEVEHSPIWCNTLNDDLCMDYFFNDKYLNLPRQMLPQYYRLNGAIYLIKRSELEKEKMFRNKCYAYIMPNIRSIDIDSDLDFIIAETIMKRLVKSL